MTTPKDFQSLGRKLARGKTLQEAASESGLTLDEAREYLDRIHQEDDQTLRAFADEALRAGLSRLKDAVKEKERIVGEGHGEGRYTNFATTDVAAARALIRAGLDARKLLRLSKKDRQAAPPGHEDRDLFDTPWEFKKEDK